MDELGRINQQDDFEDLMSNIEQESQSRTGGGEITQSPSIGKSKQMKLKRNFELNTVDLDGKDGDVFGVGRNKVAESKEGASEKGGAVSRRTGL